MEMTQEWIDQFNKKCAEFLGFVYDSNMSEAADESYYYDYRDPNYKNTGYYISDMEFHSDWNLIHEVIDKIVEIPDGFGYQFKREVEGCFDKKQAIIQNIDNFLGWYMEDQHYIDWYNKQK